MLKINSGFSLLDALIALFIFSVGLLGIASLLISGLKITHNALLKTYAMLLAEDITDRIKSNQTAAQLGLNSPYNNPTGSFTANPSCLGLDSTGASVDTQCTPSQIASNDFYEWYAKINGQTATSWHPETKAALPNGNAVVCIDSTPNDGAPSPGDPACDNVLIDPNNPVYTVKIWWNERKTGEAPSLNQFITSFVP